MQRCELTDVNYFVFTSWVLESQIAGDLGGKVAKVTGRMYDVKRTRRRCKEIFLGDEKGTKAFLVLSHRQ